MHRFVALAAEALDRSGHPVATRLAAELGFLRTRRVPVSPAPLPALAYLDEALAADQAHSLARAIAEHPGDLPWQEVDPTLIPPGYVGRHAFCEIVGPEGIALAERVRLGLYLQAPETFYPAHSHDAEEVYRVVSGTALWQAGSGDFRPVAPGGLVHHRPGEAHAMRTTAQPLLALWGWLGDIGFESYRMER